MKVSKYHVLLKWEADDEVYTVWAPSLPGCVTFGKTVDEALEMIKDAIEGYVETLKSHGAEVPTDDDVLGCIVEIVAHA